MDFSLLEGIVEKGILSVIAAVSIGFVIYFTRKLNPKLEKMNLLLEKSLERELYSKNTIDQNNAVYKEVMEFMKILNATMEANLELMKLHYEDDKQQSVKLQMHDDRSEKIFTNQKVLTEKVDNLESMTRDKFDLLFKELDVKKESEKVNGLYKQSTGEL